MYFNKMYTVQTTYRFPPKMRQHRLVNCLGLGFVNTLKTSKTSTNIELEPHTEKATLYGDKAGQSGGRWQSIMCGVTVV